jgi:hypothetical protein
MNLLVQFPTLNRADKFLKVLDKYVEATSRWNKVFFNINCDIDDSSMNDAYIQQRIWYILRKRPNVDGEIYYDKDTTKISSINAHIDERDFDIVICASDDMVPKIYAWDQEIVASMAKYFPDLDGCVHFDDGNTNGKLITFSILGKKLY